MSWLQTIKNILSNPEYPQIRGDLEELDENGEIIGKCALGELRCQTKTHQDSATDSDGRIMMAVGVPEEFYKGKNLPTLYIISNPSTGEVIGITFNEDYNFSYGGENIQDWIYGLNDSGLKYQTIIEFLETTFGDT